MQQMSGWSLLFSRGSVVVDKRVSCMLWGGGQGEGAAQHSTAQHVAYRWLSHDAVTLPPCIPLYTQCVRAWS
jgi:hypothetical protein